MAAKNSGVASGNGLPRERADRDRRPALDGGRHQRLREQDQVAAAQLDGLVGRVPAGRCRCRSCSSAPPYTSPIGSARSRAGAHPRLGDGGEEAREGGALGILPGVSGAHEERDGTPGAAREIDQEHGGIETARAEHRDGTAHRAALTTRPGAVKARRALPPRAAQLVTSGHRRRNVDRSRRCAREHEAAGGRSGWRARRTGTAKPTARCSRTSVRSSWAGSGAGSGTDPISPTSTRTRCVHLHRARHTYDPARPFEPWLFALARHCAVDHGRRLRRRTREVLVEDVPEVAVDDEPARPALVEALRALPRPQREAFTMLKLEGLSVGAAAARAGTTPGALKVRAHRAYKVLRAFLRR